MTVVQNRPAYAISATSQRFVLLGPPGSGKGTQALALVQRFGIAHISGGDMLRAEVRRQTAPGLQVRALMAAGKLVPDWLMVGLIEARLSRRDAAAGFLLDGFPANLCQAQALTGLLERQGQPLAAVLLLELAQEEILHRLSLRRSCPACGRSYHLQANAPLRFGYCDVDDTMLVQRDDDTRSAMQTRLAIYREQTTPVLDYFRERGVLRRVDASGTPAEVLEQVLKLTGREA
jgi:adenylate kinase